MIHAEAQTHPVVHSVIPAALAAQSVGLIAAGALSMLTGANLAASAVALSLVQASVAALVAVLLGQPRWWIAIHLFFVPGTLAALSLQLDARWYLGGFIALILVFGGVHRSRVPLYLSSAAAADSLLALLPRAGRLLFLDLGCGIGSVLARVSAERSGAACVGVEAALVPWLIAWLRSARGSRYRVDRESLWNTDLGASDVIYAYLSPVAMPPLWAKAKREMKPGSLLVSNRFPVPGAIPEQVHQWGALSSDTLFVYRM